MSIESKIESNNLDTGNLPEPEIGEGVEGEDESSLYLKEGSTKEKLDILERISEIGVINDEILNFIERFSNNLIDEDKKIWAEDEESASFFEDGSDEEDSTMRPFVEYFIEILEKTKGTEYQKRGEEALMNLLKKWNDFEAAYFYKAGRDYQDIKEVEECLVGEEYLAMHSEFGVDENIDDFPEDIKSDIAVNTAFVKTRNDAIKSLGNIGTKKTIDFLLKEIIENKRSAYNNEVASALLKIDPKYAKEKLIELAENNDKIVKVNSIMTLYRLQFGKLNKDRNLIIDNKDNLVCQKFHEIIGQAELNKEELENLFKGKKDISDEEIEKIVQNLISKAGQMLVDFSNKIGGDDKMGNDDLLRELENYKADLILTASVYKGVDKENVNFEDLEGVEFEKKSADDLSDEEIEQMKDIYARNYEYNSEFQKAILDNFDNILKKSRDKTEIYFYKNNDQIIAFNRFDAISEGRKYFGSFNVDPVLSSSSVGSSLMEASLEKEAENNEIEADCIPETLISSKYIGGGCGFIVKEIDSDYKNTGTALFNIERKEDNKKYRYFNCSDKEIIEEYNNENPDNQYNSDQFILKFEPKSKELVSIAEKLIGEGYIISNYVFSRNCKEVYCAFEK